MHLSAPRTLGRYSWGIGGSPRRFSISSGCRNRNRHILDRVGHPGRTSLALHAIDSDEYDTYDSDDYDEDYDGILEANSDQNTTEAARYQVVEYPEPTSTSNNSETFLYRSKDSKSPLSNGFNLFLMFGAAIDLFVSRIQMAIMAAWHTGIAFAERRTRSNRLWAQSKSAKLSTRIRSSAVGKKWKQMRKQADEIHKELPDDLWGKLLWLWDRPPVQRIRLTVSMANLSFRLPALVALIVTQGGLLASQVSLPMLAPLLLGTGMMLRSIKANASFLFPRIGVLVVMLWILWFTNSVIQNTVVYLKKQGALDDRLAGGVITVTEVSTLLVALVVLLSMLGVNVSALLLPAGIAVAVAAKDLSHNFLAGFFLFVVQPFKLGDRVAVSSSAPTQGPGPLGAPSGWFEGVCEKVDLRYTVVRQGRRRLVIPNSAFLTREFMVMDERSNDPKPGNRVGQDDQLEYLTNDNRHVWQYVHGPPLHQELAGPPGNGVYVPEEARYMHENNMNIHQQDLDPSNQRNGINVNTQRQQGNAPLPPKGPIHPQNTMNMYNQIQPQNGMGMPMRSGEFGGVQYGPQMGYYRPPSDYWSDDLMPPKSE
eukprot:jgi/Picsp_1/2661/NSC_00891-R1_mechanosensitive ion channel